MSRNKGQKPAPMPYVHQEYPRMIYREGALRPMVVKDASEEERMSAEGWGRKPIEPPSQPVPMTDTEVALDRQFRAHKTTIDSITERHGEEMRQITVRHDEITLRHKRLQDVHEELSVKHSELSKQNEALVSELRGANDRADGLVKQVGELTAEVEELRRRLAASKAVQGAAGNKKEN